MGGTLDLEKLNINVHNLPATDCTEGVICALEPIDISGQANPCNTVRVAASIEDNGECTEGSVILDQLAQAIGQCLGIGGVDTDVQSFTGVATSTDTATLNLTEDGSSLDVFLRGDNIEFSGSGTAGDPLRLTAASGTSITEGDGISITGTGTPSDPFVVTFVACGLDVLTQTQVNAASSVLSVACVDNQTVLIPVEEPVITDAELCNLPVRTQGQVDAAATVLIAACVDDTSVLIPPPTIPPGGSTDEIEAGEGIDIDVNPTAGGTEYTIELDLCELPNTTAAQVLAEPDSHFAMCVDGNNRKLRYSQAQQLFNSILVAGDDINITGDGSQADPYIISSTKQTVVQAGSNVTVTGNGDVGNPYIVNAASQPNIPSFDWLSTPVDIVTLAQPRTSGSIDTGTVSVNLNSLPGVTVPVGATAVFLQTNLSISGNNAALGQIGSAARVSAWMDVGTGALPGSQPVFSGNSSFGGGSRPSNISYVDTNLGGNDNDNAAYPIIPLGGGSTLSYRLNAVYDTTVGTGLSVFVIRVVGFAI